MAQYRTAPLQFIDNNQDRHMDALCELISMPSISTDSDYLDEVKKCAQWLAAYLEGMGMENVRLLSTDLGHPIIYADYLQAAPPAPTMLIYGHYDVQPADPLEAWESPPFEATIRQDRLYGRGTSDMKGQLMAVIIALEAAIETVGLPLNLKFLLEGQEEIGSRSLGGVIAAEGDIFRADFSLNPDAGMWTMGRPAITYGLRGMVDFELWIHGPNQDLHSGHYGGTIHNPAQAMCELIAALHHPDGMVALDGFYSGVRTLGGGEKERLAELGRDQNYFLETTSVTDLWGESDYSPFERTTARPTLEVNGIHAGYGGPGMKTIIPASAMAKISMRLVPNQDPVEISSIFRAYLEENVPKSVRWDLTQFSRSYPSLTDTTSFFVKAMEASLAEAWGLPPVYQLGGGSIPVVAMLQHALGVESILTGFSLPEDNIHSPNENLHLPTWRRGIESLIIFFEKFLDYPGKEA